MLSTIKRLHRVLVNRIAETRWLRGRAGENAPWAHYERHARAWLRASERHAAARAQASARAGKWSARTGKWQARARERHATSRLRAHDRLARIRARAQRHAPFRLLPHGRARLPANQVQETQKGEDAR
jgi:hypothetical protein